jgi:maleylacetoacetate isomerase
MMRSLYGYWRSSAAYRVRIGLNLKGLAYDQIPVNLLASEQSAETYRAINPQGFVPYLVSDGLGFAQSMAILEYLDEVYPDPPFLPPTPVERARARALANIIACDIHPLNNLRVLRYLKSRMNQSQEAIDIWYRHWVEEGFAPLEAQAGDHLYLGGDTPGLADILMVPQMYNARRLKVDVAAYPKLVAIEARLQALPAFAAAVPEVQPDAVA